MTDTLVIEIKFIEIPFKPHPLIHIRIEGTLFSHKSGKAENAIYKNTMERAEQVSVPASHRRA